MENEGKTQIICPDFNSCKEVQSTINNILVPFDDSPYSQRAFVFALDLAHHYSATITTLTIMYQSPSGATGIKHETSIESSKKLEETFKQLRETGAKFGVPVKNDTSVRTEILQSILTYITTHKFNLVVMGSRSRIGPDQYTLGSIALGICKSARCPILIVK